MAKTNFNFTTIGESVEGIFIYSKSKDIRTLFFFHSSYDQIIENVLNYVMLVGSGVFLILYVVHLYRNNWSFLVLSKKKSTSKIQVGVFFV